MGDTDLTFKEVTSENWCDLATLFEARGGPHYCWCMAWRKKPDEAKRGDAKTRKAALKQALEARVAAGTPIGILGYRGDTPVAWCSIAPRATHRPLGGPGDATDERVWSLTCFFVTRALRGKGVTGKLLAAAIAHARAAGAETLEAYPVDPKSPSYRFMGLVPQFERGGFEHAGKTGARRHVMRLDLR